MIALTPSWEEIKNLPTPLTPGELHFIKRIEDLYQYNQNRHLEIFVQSNINGDRPDIIVTEPGSGIWIIEIKDWNLSNYVVNNGDWYVLRGSKKHLIKSPFKQAERYKKNFFSLHNHFLAARNLFETGIYGAIKCGVYFHCANEENAKQYHRREALSNSDVHHIKVFGENTLDRTLLYFFNRPNYPINMDEYNHLMRYIKPSEEAMPIREIHYNDKQLSLIRSVPKKQKIKGIAGSGKSLVLAARAVNAKKRTNGRILILTFNITLVNYLHDRISEVRGKLSRKDFDIISYHTFINAECNNLGISIKEIAQQEGIDAVYDKLDLFESVKHEIQKYDAIFIDEIQDFKYEWQKILEKYFLEEKGEFILFGDEKQNVYGRDLEEKKIKTIISGNWNTLDKSYRLSLKTTELAEAYQKKYFSNRYQLDSIQLSFDLENSFNQMQYLYTNSALSVLPYLVKFIIEQQIHPNDLVFLGTRKDTMRDIDFQLRADGHKTMCMFTSLEEISKIKDYPPNTRKEIDSRLERSRKVGFWMNSGLIKLSTIQSFKGWEANNIFLFIEPRVDEQESFDELVYTGITRCKKNLFIINVGNLRLHHFFQENRELFKIYNDTELPLIR